MYTKGDFESLMLTKGLMYTKGDFESLMLTKGFMQSVAQCPLSEADQDHPAAQHINPGNQAVTKIIPSFHMKFMFNRSCKS